MMIQVIAAIIALSKSIKIIDDWVRQLTLEYHKRKVAENDKDFLTAMDEARKGNVTDLAANIGSMLDD